MPPHPACNVAPLEALARLSVIRVQPVPYGNLECTVPWTSTQWRLQHANVFQASGLWVLPLGAAVG